MIILCLHHYFSYFMFTPDYAEELNEYIDDMSCMTRYTGTVGTLFRHAVDEANSELNTKRPSADSGNLQDYLDAISHEPSEWEDLENCHMTHIFWREFGTYLGQNAKNNNLGKIPRSKNKTTKTGDLGRKKARNDTVLLLHPPEKEDDKGLPDLLACKPCTAYMGNLKTMIMDKFC